MVVVVARDRRAAVDYWIGRVCSTRYMGLTYESMLTWVCESYWGAQFLVLTEPALDGDHAASAEHLFVVRLLGCLEISEWFVAGTQLLQPDSVDPVPPEWSSSPS